MHNPVTIRRFEKTEDGDLLINAYRDPEYKDFFRRVSIDWNKEQILNFEANTGAQVHTIFYGEHRLGFCEISRVCNFGLTFQAGIILFKDYHDQVIEGRKVCFWAMKALGDFIFGNTHLRKMQMMFLSSRKDIEASLLKAGLTFEATFPYNIKINDEYVSETQYYILKEDYYKKYPKS
jgi:hypothetical protein